MRRLIRAVAFACSALAVIFGFVSPSKAVNSLAYSFVLPCNSSTAQTSLTDLPTGTYAVIVTGACALDGNQYTLTVDSCSVTPPPSPCTSVGPIERVPGQACWAATNTYAVRPCDQDGPQVLSTMSCGDYGIIEIDGACRGTGQAYTYTRTSSGPMSARVADVWDGHDNLGMVMVTVIWTPLD